MEQGLSTPSFDYQFCSRKGFLDNSALKTHQVKNALCGFRQRVQQRVNQRSGTPGASNIPERDPDVPQKPDYPDVPDMDMPPEGLFDIEEDPVQGILDFDVTFQLVFFIRQCCNGGGLSRKDINKLLQLLHHPKFDVRDITVKSAHGVCKYKDSLTEQQDGAKWKQIEVQEEAENSPSVHLYLRNPVTVLEELYSNPKIKDSFALRSSVITNENTRVYTTLESGTWWEEMEADVQSSCVGALVAPIILYSDQTSLSHNRRTQGWPLVMTLGNISSNARSLTEGHSLLAILPTTQTQDTDVLGTRTPSRAKSELLHKCEELILAPLKEASKRGLHLKDPHGNSQWVYPRLCLYICDQSEGSKITCTYDTNKSQYPCSCCYCPRELLSDVSKKFPYRTESAMKQIFKEMEECPAGEREQLSKQHSVHLVQCALWDFAGSELKTSSPYRCIQLDGLHQSILGIFKTLLGIVRQSVSEFNLVTRPLQELDRRIHAIQKHCRFASFRLPGNPQNGYFQSNANYHGFEHKFVMQIVVFCLPGVVPDNIISVFVDFIDWYLIAFQSKQHTEDSLNKMDQLMQKSVTSMKKNVTRWQKSNFNTVKIHFMVHLKDCIQRCGLPSEYDTGIYEHLHIVLMKIPYRHSNRRQFEAQMMRHNERKHLLLEEAETREDVYLHHEDETALDKAVFTGHNVLSGKDLVLCPLWLREDLHNQQQREVNDLLQSQPEIGTYFLPLLTLYMKEEGLELPVNLQIWNSLAVPAGVGDRFGDWPMYTRACRNFHGRCWFGFIEMQMEALGMDPITWVGQIRLLFSCVVHDKVGKRIEKELAFVKVMRQVQHDHTWKLHKCEQFTFVDEGVERCRGKHLMTPVEPYIILDIANVTRVVHMVPNFTQDGHFYLNRFKL